MRFTKIWVDLVLASGDEFIVRYEYYTVRRNREGKQARSTRTVSSPTYARVVSSKSIQMYDIDTGSIRKAGNGVVAKDLMDFTNAVYQADLMAASGVPVLVGP